MPAPDSRSPDSRSPDSRSPDSRSPDSRSPDSRSDDVLVAALNGGDASAFDALYYRYRDWVVRMACRITGNSDDALDVLQETFSYLFRKFPGFTLTASMTTFLYPVVKNLSIAARKKRIRASGGEALLDGIAGPAAAGPDPRSELTVALAALPETHREVLLLRFVDALSLEEIGQAMGIPEGTVKSRIHNGLEMLRRDPRARAYFVASR